MDFIRLVNLGILILVVGCAPDNSFKGNSGKMGKTTPPAEPLTPETPENLQTPELEEDDQETLKSCQQKSPAMMQGVKLVDSVDIGSSVSNTQDFSDYYGGDDRRVLIVNVVTPIANKVSLRLSSSKTIYCLNVTSQIINKMDIGVARGARLIEARKVSISNKISTHEI